MSKPAPTTETPTSTERRCFHCWTGTDDNWFTYKGENGEAVLVCLGCAVHGDEVHYGEKGPRNYKHAGLAAIERYYAGELPSIHTLVA